LVAFVGVFIVVRVVSENWKMFLLVN